MTSEMKTIVELNAKEQEVLKEAYHILKGFRGAVGDCETPMSLLTGECIVREDLYTAICVLGTLKDYHPWEV